MRQFHRQQQMIIRHVAALVCIADAHRTLPNVFALPRTPLYRSLAPRAQHSSFAHETVVPKNGGVALQQPASPTLGNVTDGRYRNLDVFVDWLAKERTKRGVKWQWGLARIEGQVLGSSAKASKRKTRQLLAVLVHEACARNPAARSLLIEALHLVKQLDDVQSQPEQLPSFPISFSSASQNLRGRVREFVKATCMATVYSPTIQGRVVPVRSRASGHYPKDSKLNLHHRHSRIVVLRQSKGKMYALLQHRSTNNGTGVGRMAFVGGERRSTDRDSVDTAERTLYAETGLLDVGYLKNAPEWVHALAFTSDASPPLFFKKFSEDEQTDWWVVVLRGSGKFACHSLPKVLDATPLLDHLPEAELAECYGHLWLPTDRKYKGSEHVSELQYIEDRISDAIASLGQPRLGTAFGIR